MGQVEVLPGVIFTPDVRGVAEPFWGSGDEVWERAANAALRAVYPNVLFVDPFDDHWSVLVNGRNMPVVTDRIDYESLSGLDSDAFDDIVGRCENGWCSRCDVTVDDVA